MICVSITDLIPSSFNLLTSIFKTFPSLLFLLIFISLGVIISMLIDKFLPNNNNKNISNKKLYRLGLVSMLAIIMHNIPEGVATFLSSSTNRGLGLSLALAISFHNIPEGMAVGIVFASTLSQNITVSLTGALALSIGIAIQNFPEGAIISMPLKAEGKSKNKAFFYGVLSGIVEPIGAIITILLATMITPILPYFLAFAAGAMIYVVIEELIPDAKEGNHSNLTVIGVAFGFVLMMILDVALG